ncbi:Appr-1-p processing protein [Streptomyces sp. NPDC057438]|uniref:Appr-1-p processing protein n=1 Tax=Streptomyces sp. NPDC057438 TaxID=3346133 RepID=UPI00368D6E23
MPGITYVRGDATTPLGEGVKIIAHVVKDMGGRGKGFVLAPSRRRPEPEAAYRAWHRARADNDFGLGAAQFVRVGPYLRAANLVGRHGTRSGSKGAPVRYEAIDTALGLLADQALELEASVHVPRIGCGLAGGRWSRVEPLTADRLVRRGIPVTVDDHGD